MTESGQDDRVPDDRAASALSDAVKSAILDRLLDDLRADRALATPRSVYTKSDSGLYGKYEKAEGINEDVLRLIRVVLEDLAGGIEPELPPDRRADP